MDLDFFREALRLIDARGPVVSRDAIYAVIEQMTAQETQGAPSIEHLCLLGGVSRAGFYRFGDVREPKRTKMDLPDKIHCGCRSASQAASAARASRSSIRPCPKSVFRHSGQAEASAGSAKKSATSR
jgi:hypothetical protein